MKAFLGLLVVFTTSSLFAATVSTSCYTGTPAYTRTYQSTQPSQCAASDATGAVTDAFAQVYYTGASSVGGWNTISMHQYADALYGNISTDPTRYTIGMHITSTAQASFSYDQTFQTAGPVRWGYLQLSLTGYAGGLIYDGSEGISIALSPADNPYLTKVSCSLGQTCAFPAFVFNQGTLIPYTLGTTFDITAIGHLTAYADVNDGTSGGEDNLGYQFRFFEADGVTPVAVSEAPEPATFVLLGLSLGVALMIKRKRLLI